MSPEDKDKYDDSQFQREMTTDEDRRKVFKELVAEMNGVDPKSVICMVSVLVVAKDPNDEVTLDNLDKERSVRVEINRYGRPNDVMRAIIKLFQESQSDLLKQLQMGVDLKVPLGKPTPMKRDAILDIIKKAAAQAGVNIDVATLSADPLDAPSAEEAIERAFGRKGQTTPVDPSTKKH